MEDLRLVGVHEDGQHLLLSDGEGARYRLPLDDALRAAARRDRPRLGQLQIELDGGLRPREVQALIRSGLGAEEVAHRAGWPVEKVHRYEGPVLAEREHVASLARSVRLRHSSRSTEPTLASRVADRLAGRGVDPSLASWDAARDAEGQWTVLVLFPAGGRERSATWVFDVPARTVHARDDEARWLSEEDTGPDGPIPSPHRPVPTGPSTVYDLESDGGVDGPRPRRRPAHDPVDLMAAMRESSRARRPRRRSHSQPTLTPVDSDPREDAFPLEPTLHEIGDHTPPPAARGPHPLDSARGDDDDAGGGQASSEEGAEVEVQEPGDLEADEAAAGEGASRSSRSGLPAADGSLPSPDPAGGQPTPFTQARPRRGGRRSVPRWDDIMFGPRGSAAPDRSD